MSIYILIIINIIHRLETGLEMEMGVRVKNEGENPVWEITEQG